MKWVRLLLTPVICAAILVLSPTPIAAYPGVDREPNENEPYPEDVQAYAASAWVPAVRPQVVVGSLVVITVLALILINSQDSGHIHR